MDQKQVKIKVGCQYWPISLTLEFIGLDDERVELAEQADSLPLKDQLGDPARVVNRASGWPESSPSDMQPI